MRLPDIDLNFRLPKPPFIVLAILMILVVASWIPLALIARSWVTLSPKPRVHIFHDMDHQPKKNAQETSIVFADGMAMRPPVQGTVARGELQADDHYWRGYTAESGSPSGGEAGSGATYLAGIPEQITVDEQFIRRGQTYYNINCYPCHGKDGAGNGPVNFRASQLPSGGWTPASNLVATNDQGELTYGSQQMNDGRLFNVISHGYGNMPGYSDQIKVRDRWAIVAYVRALQQSQAASPEDVPEDRRAELE